MIQCNRPLSLWCSSQHQTSSINTINLHCIVSIIFHKLFLTNIHTIWASLKPWASLGCKIFSSVPSASWWLLLLPHTYTITASFSDAVDADEPALHEHRQLEARVQIYNTHIYRFIAEKFWILNIYLCTTNINTPLQRGREQHVRGYKVHLRLSSTPEYWRILLGQPVTENDKLNTYYQMINTLKSYYTAC